MIAGIGKAIMVVVPLMTALLAAATEGQAAPAPKKLIEPLFLAHSVAMGDLPPVERRMPENPAIAVLPQGQGPGKQGGILNILMAQPRDVRMMMVYGYARLVRYDTKYEIVADILESFEVKENRIFTLHLRKGHRWSDGRPFTAEDFRYYWEDVANNQKLSPGGLNMALLVEGKGPRFEIINATTVRYSWPKPNPYFLPSLAAAAPLFIYRPAHYLKRFHARYASSLRLSTLAKRNRTHNWAALHDKKDNQYRFDNPDLPTLQPWVNKTWPPSQRFIFFRNPYYYRIDSDGRQLPYIDRVFMTIANHRLIAAKTAAGESDLQARNLYFKDYTFLKAAEKRNDYKVRLWRTSKGSHLALYPNLNTKDRVWRALFQDRRFRRALSQAIDRHEINQVLYYGLAIEGNNSVLPQSPLYQREHRFSWTRFDLGQANALLDEIGLDKRNSRGLRLLPDGRPMNLIIETAGEQTEQADILELVHDSWLKIGIKLFTRPSQREVFRKRVMSGETLMSIWSGLNNGIVTANMSPSELVPTNPYQLQWPDWGRYYQTSGRSGTAPSLASVRQLVALNQAWKRAKTEPGRTRIWRKILALHSREVFTIGLISGVLHPVVVSNRLRNVPREGIYGWNPGAYFGIYKPDIFWLAGRRKPRAQP